MAVLACKLQLSFSLHTCFFPTFLLFIIFLSILHVCLVATLQLVHFYWVARANANYAIYARLLESIIVLLSAHLQRVTEELSRPFIIIIHVCELVEEFNVYVCVCEQNRGEWNKSAAMKEMRIDKPKKKPNKWWGWFVSINLLKCLVRFIFISTICWTISYWVTQTILSYNYVIEMLLFLSLSLFLIDKQIIDSTRNAFSIFTHRLMLITTLSIHNNRI